MLVCLSPNGSTHFNGDAEPDHLLVATLEGVVSSSRMSGAWSESSTQLDGRHVSSLAWEPSSESVFAGSYDGGLFVSEDMGQTWQSLERGPFDEMKVYSLAAREEHGRTALYVGTEPAHLFRSDDLGASWRELAALRDVSNTAEWTFPAEPHDAHVKNVTFHPVDRDTLYVCVEQGGLYRSTDAGRSFQELEGIGELDANKDVHRLVIRPSDPLVMHLSGGDGSFVSTNGATSWTRYTDRSFVVAYPDGLVMSPQNEELLFMSGAIGPPGSWRVSHRADSRVVRSSDGGQRWESVNEGLPAPLRGNIEAMSIAGYPSGAVLFIATTEGEVFSSSDLGESWQLILSGLPAVSKGGHFLLLR